MMYGYATSLAVEGAVRRQALPGLDKGWIRKRSLDSLLSSRIFALSALPDSLIYASQDGQRPGFAGLFQRTSLVNSLPDLWNAILKEPSTAACFVQIVDELPGLDDPARLALEQSLIRVKPYNLEQFEHLLEVQEKVYPSLNYQPILFDRLGRLQNFDAKGKRVRGEKPDKAVMFVDAVFHGAFSQSRLLNLRGQDCQVQDFRRGLMGVSDLFRHWDDRMEKQGKPEFEKIYIYSHLRGLLPGCWEELRVRGVNAGQVRIPQWIGHANAISSFVEFLLADGKNAAFVFLAQNGQCHFAEWERDK